jgi:hypothetical protein
MSPGLQVGAAPASGLLRSFERADASLALASQKLEGEFAQNFSGAADSRLNPMRLLKRLAALEEELPTLREAAEKNAIARRTVLGTLHAQHVTNHAQMSALAQRAHAPVDEASVEWKLAEQTASLCIAKTCSQEKDVPPPPPEEEDEEAAATAIAPAPPPLPPPVETIAAPPSTIPELQWLRCPASDAWQPHARRAEHLLGSATRAVCAPRDARVASGATARPRRAHERRQQTEDAHPRSARHDPTAGERRVPQDEPPSTPCTYSHTLIPYAPSAARRTTR